MRVVAPRPADVVRAIEADMAAHAGLTEWDRGAEAAEAGPEDGDVDVQAGARGPGARPAGTRRPR